jgi:outer membrane autotransporter protein
LTYTSGSVSDITVTDTSKVLDYSLSESSEDLILTVSTASVSSMGINSRHTNSVSNAVTALLDNNDDTAWDALVSLSTSAALEYAAEQMALDAGATAGAALAAVSGVNNVISSRQTNARVAFNALGSQSGISTGDYADDLVVWAQIFGSSATQDKVGTIDGYDADSSGLALGWETEKSGDLMGLSVSYSDSDVDGKSASASHTDTTAVQVSAYGTYGKATDWMVGYASGDNDTKRTVNFGGLSLVASGKYDSNIFTAKVGHAFASSNSGDWTMTPKVDASYTNIDNDGYTETGANNLNLIVASSSNDILTARLGAEFTQHIVDGDAVTIPHFNIMAGYDLKNDGGETSSTFTGGGSVFTTKGADPEKASIQLGFGVDHVSDDSTVSLDLNADLRSDYDSMSGSLTFKSKF